MKTNYEKLSKRELIVQLEGRDSMIDHLKREEKVAKSALKNCADNQCPANLTCTRQCAGRKEVSRRRH